MLERHLLIIGSSIATWAVAASIATAEVPDDPALSSSSVWTRFLAEAFPEGIDPERSRQPLTIRDPGPDTANYPNGPNTLPRGGIYLELSPVFFTGPISTIQPQTYSAEFLLRMGLTDRFEFRLYSGGFTWQAAGLGMAEYNVGISDDSTQGGYQPVDIIQWAISKELTDDFQVFVHGFQNQSALPRVVAQTVVGTGFVWFPSDRLSIFGNWGFGTDKSGPASTFQAGLANSF